MADIELVIKISEEDWKFLKDWEFLKDSDECRWSRAILEAVINGTPLPKGHGRLIDADAVINQEFGCYWETKEDLKHAHTIIEADAPKKRKGTPLEENDSGYNCENWIP